jgi:C-terminal processing protease CtpA/Prc
MRVTVAEWFTPSRGRIQDEGIRPDLQIAAGGHEEADDPVLATAIGMLESGQSKPSDLRIEATPVATP